MKTPIPNNYSDTKYICLDKQEILFYSAIKLYSSLSNTRWKVIKNPFLNISSLPRQDDSPYLKLLKQSPHSLPVQPQCGEEAWFSKHLHTLKKLGQLPNNWDSGGAEPPNKIAINRARKVLLAMFRMNLLADRVIPSVENGLGISFVRGDQYADIECFNTGEILAVISDRKGNPEVWVVKNNSESIESALRKIRDFIRR